MRSALSEPEKKWLEQCDAVDRQALLDRHRHNLPEWLVASLKAQLGERFWDYVAALNRPQGLDLRVNALAHKRAEAQALLKKERIASERVKAVASVAGNAGVTCHAHTVEALHPWEAILDHAKTQNCDLVVMASHGRKGIKRLLLGSETQQVLTHCHVPVLVLR